MDRSRAVTAYLLQAPKLLCSYVTMCGSPSRAPAQSSREGRHAHPQYTMAGNRGTYSTVILTSPLICSSSACPAVSVATVASPPFGAIVNVPVASPDGRYTNVAA